jgi:hypothetical protein
VQVEPPTTRQESRGLEGEQDGDNRALSQRRCPTIFELHICPLLHPIDQAGPIRSAAAWERID